jgi:hypothetical protein
MTSFLCVYWLNFCVHVSSLICGSTCPASHIPLDLSTHIYLVKSTTGCEAPQFATQFLPLRINYSPQHPVSKNPQSMFFPSKFTLIKNI